MEFDPGTRRIEDEGPDQNILSAAGFAQISVSMRIVSPSIPLKKETN